MNDRTKLINRPSGAAPVGTSKGILAYIILSAGVPFFIVESLIPVFTGGIDTWISSIIPVLAVALFLSAIVVGGLFRRRHWYVCYMFGSGCVLLAGYVVGVGLSVTVLLRLLPVVHPELLFGNAINIVMWLLLAPLAWLLSRMLRLRYWQPWTAPGEWEPGDENSPRWGMSLARPPTKGP